MTDDEIEMLTERFEIGGRIHYGYFLQFFRETTTAPLSVNSSKGRARTYTAVDGSLQVSSNKPKVSMGISPFRMSSEWAALKAEVVKDYSLERENCNKDMNLIDNKLAILNNLDNNKNKNDTLELNKNKLNDISNFSNKDSKDNKNNNKVLLLLPDKKAPIEPLKPILKAESKRTKLILDLDTKFDDNMKKENINNNNNNNNKMESKNVDNDKLDISAVPKTSTAVPKNIPKNIRSHLGQYEEVLAEEKKENDRIREMEYKGNDNNNLENKDILNDKKTINNGLNRDENSPNMATEIDNSPGKKSMLDFTATTKKMAHLPAHKSRSNLNINNSNKTDNNNNNNSNSYNNNNSNDNNNNNDNSNNNNVSINTNNASNSNKIDGVNPSRMSWFNRGKSAGNDLRNGKEKENEGKYDNNDTNQNKENNYNNNSDNNNYYNNGNGNESKYNESKNNDNDNNNSNYSSNKMILDTSLKQPQPSQSPSKPGLSRFLSWGKKDQNINTNSDRNAQSVAI